jgi:hypothetical protein
MSIRLNYAWTVHGTVEKKLAELEHNHTFLLNGATNCKETEYTVTRADASTHTFKFHHSDDATVTFGTTIEVKLTETDGFCQGWIEIFETNG